jgi:hypothetical protein
MTIGKRVGRHNPRTGWNPAADPEWQYRKTLDKDNRDVYDSLPPAEQLAHVQRFIRHQSKVTTT